MGELNYYDSDTIDAERIKGNGTVVGVEDVADNKGHRSNRFNIKVRDHSAHRASAVLDVCTKTPQEKLAWIAAVHKVISTAEKTARVDALRAQLEPPRPKPAEGTSSTLDRVVLQERSEALAGTPQADEADKILGQLVASASKGQHVLQRLALGPIPRRFFYEPGSQVVTKAGRSTASANQEPPNGRTDNNSGTSAFESLAARQANAPREAFSWLSCMHAAPVLRASGLTQTCSSHSSGLTGGCVHAP
jgi:hypothetical protein